MPNEAPITVSQLNRKAKTLLEQGIARLWVEGEISNLSRPSSGHIYLSLKDENAQVSAAWFRQRQRGPAIGFKNGDKVLAYGRVSIYEARGNYQLIIEQMEPAGEGVLKQRFDALKKKLLAEGLFAEDRKRKLPALPSRIGVITSPSGAAIRDIVSVLGRRFPAVPVIIYPAAVQGEAAPGELMAALETAIRRDECDVLIIGRGGGSLEDLWAFNDEALARAIADCPIPIVSAVGHEVDFTISDFVADVRAPTPSGAAEIVVPNQHDWLHRVSTLAMRIGRIGERKVQDRAQELDWLGKRLVAASPKATLQRQHDGLRENRSRLAAIMRTRLLEMRNNTQALGSELLQQSPALTVQRSIGQLATLRQRLGGSARDALSDVAHRIALLGRALNSVSPLATLDRGYAIVLDEDGKALTDASNANKGDEIRARLAKGELVARVTKVVKKQ
ncbi:MAG: exodeoxyribonuclease VII large subunit [Gammaproteobacteria bacterium]|jgi:exodeoxyribonuclease VII large subunit|nr:exodeoxyribonuclease VII large subunit [Gammaproteobacteria bacterium]MDH4006059.1 exodeoxyribonuclease VII large subunit [Gammaproteobacteria bacterium]